MSKDIFPEIQTERLSLRRLEEADWQEVSFLRSDKHVNEFVKRPSAETKAKALEFISKINTGIDNQSFYYWKITLSEQNQMIGSICLWNFSNDYKTAELGYDLHPNFQGKGIMSEAMISVLAYGFDTLNLENIQAFTHRLNDRSRKLLESKHFKLGDGKKDSNNVNNVIYELSKSSSVNQDLIGTLPATACPSPTKTSSSTTRKRT